jgi:hypothetical protein
MDPKGKGIVINDKEKESFINEPKDDKPTDSGQVIRRRTGRKGVSRRSSTTTTTTSLLLLVFLIIQMHICFPFLLVNLHTLMERTTDFGVTKCVVTCSLFIQVYGR